MTRRRTSNTTRKAPGSQAGGFLFDISLPPIAVIVVSLIMTCVLGQVTAASSAQFSENLGDSQIAMFFTPEVQYWKNEIATWSAQWDVDPNLIATVMQIESCGNPRAKSGAGAMGLFQVMPYHFSEDENPYRVSTNAYRGISYLKSALEARDGNIKYALAGYNGGIYGTQKPEHSWPQETIRYVYWGVDIYWDAKDGKDSSARLAEWLAAGGASLCASAAQSLGIK